MDYLNFKLDFLGYLKQKEISTDQYVENKNDEEVVSISIFEKTEEFKTYTTDVLKLESENINLSISELRNMEFKDGKFIEKDSPNTDKTKDEDKDIKDTKKGDDTESQETSEETKNTERNKFINFLNSLLGDKEIVEKLDTDKSGDLSQDEIQEFIDNINVIDSENEDFDKENLSMKEVFDGIIKIAKDEYGKEEKEKEEKEKITEVESTNEAYVNKSKVPQSNSSVRRYRKYNYNPKRYTRLTGNQITRKKDITNMSKTELEAEKEKVQTTITSKKKELDEINNDTAPEIKALKEAMDNNYELYQEKLKEIAPKLAEELKELTEKETEAQKIYDEKQNEFNTALETLSNAENNLKIAQSTLKSFEYQLAKLNNIDTSKYPADKLADLNNKKSKLEAEIVAKKQAVTKATEARDAALEAKNKIETEELPNLKENLEEAKKAKNELEKKIKEENHEIKELQDKHIESKNEYETKKAEAIAKIQEEIKFSQNKIQQVDSEIAKRIVNDDLSQYCSIYYSPELIAKLRTNHKINISIINGEQVLHYNWAHYNKVRPELNESLQQLEEFAFSKGYVIVRSDGERSFAASEKAHRERPDSVSPAGESPHNYGAGADLTIFDMNGKEYSFHQLPEIYKYAEENCGLKWGGHFKNKKRAKKERHHFELQDWRDKYKKNEYKCG